MVDLLTTVRNIMLRLPEFMEDRGDWCEMLIFTEPIILRLLRRYFIDSREYRLFIHALKKGNQKGDLHRHPWSFASAVLFGELSMEWGDGVGQQQPTEVKTLILKPGDCYSMTRSSSWHSMTPLSPTVYVLEFIGPAFQPKVELDSPPDFGIAPPNLADAAFIFCKSLQLKVSEASQMLRL